MMLDSSSAKSHRRKSSRSNSTSSSSIVTVKRAASLSSRTSSRNPVPTSEQSSTRSGLLTTRDPSATRDRSTTGNSRPGSLGGIKEGVGNLNRWSQSTASSKTSTPGPVGTLSPENAHKRRRSLSQRLSIGGSSSLGSLKTLTNPQSTPSRNVLTKARHSPRRSTGGSSEIPKLEPLPADTLPALFTAAAGADSAPFTSPLPPDLITPSAQSLESGDYFSEKWNGVSPASSKNTTLGPSTSLSATQVEEKFSPRKPNNKAELPQGTYIDSLKPRLDEPAVLGSGHNRNRDGAKGSGGTEGGSSTSSMKSDKERGRKHRSTSQKTMLSKALQKANTAVLLDNAQNYEGAMEAYEDACRLLQQVMHKSSGEDDKKKLESIRTTYTNRIRELRGLDNSYQVSGGKALPHRPTSDGTVSTESRASTSYEDEEGIIIGTATATRIVNTIDESEPNRSQAAKADQPVARQSLVPSALHNGVPIEQSSPPRSSPQPRNFSRSPRRDADRAVTPRGLAPPMQAEYMPPPLSPRRGNSPNPAPNTSRNPAGSEPESVPALQPPRQISEGTETTSWLDTIDESGGSSASSVHSRSSSFMVRRRRIRQQDEVEDTEAEFGAALDAAVEAAYNDDFDIENETDQIPPKSDPVAHSRRNVEIARARVREAEQEAARIEQDRRFQDDTFRRQNDNIYDHEYLDEEAEEEERLLEEMTNMGLDEFDFNLQSKSALPRQSDSSSFSGRTWGSSVGSNTAPTSLTPSTDSGQLASKQKLPPLRAGPIQIPPPKSVATETSRGPPPSQTLPRPPSFGSIQGMGVRDRRLSGQNAKQLKIETSTKTSTQAPRTIAATTEIPRNFQKAKEEPKTASLATQIKITAIPPIPTTRPPLEPHSRSDSRAGPHAESGSLDTGEVIPNSPAKPIAKISSAPDTLRKNASYTSLKSRNMSVSAPDAEDASPITPHSSGFPIRIENRRGITATGPAMPTPTGTNFTVNGMPTGGMYLFDDQIKSPESPDSVKATSASAPAPLEPCPDSFLLRPFWLMRCLHQTLAHPRGGYITTKLFVPRDVWRVKNVKLRSVEEKISACDLLTAALQKLALVDTLDAQKMFQEMQAFETVIDSVRTTLSKKLGNEVGGQNSAALFKTSAVVDEPSNSVDALTSRNANGSGKSYLSGWRKLRNKSSGAALTNTTSSAVIREGTKEGLSLSSLPMTSNPPSRHRKRSTAQVQHTGPNANYMGALARLFEAVQVLDQIARQAEDPGLKGTSEAHVGLELSTRTAAEFFGFYICRFALNDMGMMLDKFIKRGSEWVLA